MKNFYEIVLRMKMSIRSSMNLSAKSVSFPEGIVITSPENTFSRYSP